MKYKQGFYYKKDKFVIYFYQLPKRFGIKFICDKNNTRRYINLIDIHLFFWSIEIYTK